MRFSASRCSNSDLGTRSKPEVICRMREKVSSASSSVNGGRSFFSSNSGIGLVLHGVRRDQVFVGEATADRAGSDCQEPSAVRTLAGVEPEDLFVDVAVKMERSDGNVSAVERPLE